MHTHALMYAHMRSHVRVRVCSRARGYVRVYALAHARAYAPWGEIRRTSTSDTPYHTPRHAVSLLEVPRTPSRKRGSFQQIFLAEVGLLAPHPRARSTLFLSSSSRGRRPSASHTPLLHASPSSTCDFSCKNQRRFHRCKEGGNVIYFVCFLDD